MENIIGKWGWVSIDELTSHHFKIYIHPRTLEKLENYKLTDYVFQCTNILPDNYLKLKSTEIEIALKEDVFRLMPEQPIFKPRQKVKFHNSKNVLEFGVIKSINWHNNDQRLYYTIEVNNKIKGRRYYADDLEKSDF